MSTDGSLAGIVRSLTSDPEYVAVLTARIAARAEDPQIIERLVAYARERQATTGHAVVRKVLTDAGVAWEAL